MINSRYWKCSDIKKSILTWKRSFKQTCIQLFLQRTEAVCCTQSVDAYIRMITQLLASSTIKMQNAYASSIMVWFLEIILFRPLRHAVKGDESKLRDTFGGTCAPGRRHTKCNMSKSRDHDVNGLTPLFSGSKIVAPPDGVAVVTFRVKRVIYLLILIDFRH